MNKKKVNKIKYWILPFLALLVFGLTRLFSRYPVIAEHYYSQMLYPVIASVLSSVSRLVPVSLDDLFYLVLIITGVVIAVLLVSRKIRAVKSAFFVLNVLSAVYIAFYLLWGFNYFRANLNTRLSIDERSADTEEFKRVFSHLVKVTNESYTSFEAFNEKEVSLLIEEGYRQLAPVLRIKYPAGTRRPKNITFSGFFAQAGISGYFGPFFNEVHVNKKLLPLEYPFVLAHEKAHQFGITGEAEANFYAWLVCSKSSSLQLQYSANLFAVRYFLFYGPGQNHFKDAVSKLDGRVIEDIKKIQQHWMNLRNEKVEAAAAKVNDAYLKTNQVEKGIRDYTGIIKHIMEFSLDTAFREKTGL